MKINWDKLLKILILLILIYILFYIKGCSYRNFTNDEIDRFFKEWEKDQDRKHFEPPEWRP